MISVMASGAKQSPEYRAEYRAEGWAFSFICWSRVFVWLRLPRRYRLSL